MPTTQCNSYLPIHKDEKLNTEAYALEAKCENFSSAVYLAVHTLQNKNFFVEVVRRIRKIAKRDYWLRLVRPSVRPHGTGGGIFMIFDI